METLINTVRSIYSVLRKTEKYMAVQYDYIEEILPKEIAFVSTQELVDMYPDLTPKEREYKIVKEKGAVFLMQVGKTLSNGERHDGRAPDYDDWELNGDILLNFDTEVWGEFVIGSAGGIDITATLDYKEVETDKEDAAVKVTLKGLKGGHSGIEINEGRANANKCMVRFVREAISELDARLASWQGGNMRNAIPFQAEVVLTLPKENIEALNDLVADWKDEICDEFEGIETTENIEFFAENVETPKMQVPAEIQDNLVDAIYACHDGVLRMAPSMPEIVETSSNLAIVEIGDGKAAIKILARSSHEYYKMYLATMIESCFNMAGMKVEFSGSYMGWNPNPKSDILEHVLKVYKEQNGTDGKVQAVHAGLECSIILSKYPNLDVVSFGPTLLSPHTANERCQISCVAPFWNLVKQLLTEIPAK